jgi:hypothetical protein
VRLVEVIAGAAIAAFLMWGLVAMAGRLAASADSLNGRLNAEANADRLIERLSSDAASAWTVSAPNANEIDFYAEDGSHRPYAWAYRYDASAKTVTRSTGEVLGSFDSFSASAATVGDLAISGSSAYDPLFAGASTPSEPGNALVALHITGTGVDRTELLASGAAPTTFTVVVTYTPSPTPIATATPTPLR